VDSRGPCPLRSIDLLMQGSFGAKQKRLHGASQALARTSIFRSLLSVTKTLWVSPPPIWKPADKPNLKALERGAEGRWGGQSNRSPYCQAKRLRIHSIHRRRYHASSAEWTTEVAYWLGNPTMVVELVVGGHAPPRSLLYPDLGLGDQRIRLDKVRGQADGIELRGRPRFALLGNKVALA
jgi:hypothetical protein